MQAALLLYPAQGPWMDDDGQLPVSVSGGVPAFGIRSSTPRHLPNIHTTIEDFPSTASSSSRTCASSDRHDSLPAHAPTGPASPAPPPPTPNWPSYVVKRGGLPKWLVMAMASGMHGALAEEGRIIFLPRSPSIASKASVSPRYWSARMVLYDRMIRRGGIDDVLLE